MKTETRTEIEAAVFRRLVSHLDSRKDVQNLDLMNLSGFCRNCLAKWYSAESVERGEEITVDSAKERKRIMKTETRTEIEAAVFRRLLSHLDSRKDVQNLDLMNLSGFCRNCLAKWYSAEAEERGEEITVDSAKEIVYGMTHGEWKANYQK